MLEINMEDVVNVIASVRMQLIAVAVALVLALVLTIAVNRRTVRETSVRKLAHAQTWIVAVIAMIVAVSTMLFGPLNTMLSLLGGSDGLSEETIARSKDLAVDIEREGIVMLKNDGDTLPLASKKVNVFGWASTNPIYGGTGSGSMNDQYETTSLLQSLHDAGIETNDELTDFYTQYRADRPNVSIALQDWTLPEPPADTYSDELVSDAKSFSDTAVVVLARSGGEGSDLPEDMSKMGSYNQMGDMPTSILTRGTDDQPTPGGAAYYNNSADYSDFEAGEGYLNLSKTEEDMIDLVSRNFDNVVLVYNGANAINMSFVDEHPQIRSVLWVPPAGQTGFEALGEIMTGAANPSGRTADTFVRDFSQAPWANNFGSFVYTDADDLKFPSVYGGRTIGERVPSFVNYVEGIYVGYKYYETAAEEGAIDYDKVVQYPFGYGLSYTDFEQKMGKVTYADGKVSFDVTVTNAGDVAGKDTVEVYYDPPYVNGGIEKASANLIDFAKTDELKPGESQTITFEFAAEDMASYDDENAKAYVLESGDYGISIRKNSHDVIDEQTIGVDETITYSGENHRSSDASSVTNEFDDIKPTFETLSRADRFANFAKVTAAPADTSMPEQYKKTLVNASNYKNVNDDSDEMPNMDAKNGVRLYELYGKDYDDELWDKLLDELSWNDMDTLIATAGYSNAAIESIDKPQQSDVDGPSTLNNNFTGVGSIGLPSGVSVANTFNQDLALQFGETIGDMAHEMDVTGWYAPAMNVHRTPYGGRNFEYFSEDGLLSGRMAAQQVAGAKSKGVYAFIKHFALNNQETNRRVILCTWADEQTMREIYLKPFELSVKDGGATAVMTGLNYIGNVYAGAYEPLLKNVLRDEWGFRGMVLTDYFSSQSYQIGDQAMRAGNDAMLATTDTTNHISDKSATSTKAMREACHNILYTAVNSWIYANGQPKVAMPLWQRIYFAVVAVLGVALIALEAVTIRRFIARRRGATVEVKSAAK
ncbi:glycoside hydrolase family 3 N-terminal domain-containing protein [Bifidobacterium aerophilum]|uniref:Beta-glucosidase n=1 Tax=Bifidobacterium aerophilum TaxID=1798155 RepID=A0A6N9Z7J9_9BIFI|nr:glycoside hydrolase family 3 N-terminal domain-containing protein [Bifidobacterium aerophilum]NEG90416.1 beta-glucosidase [Bifidobacterium aerophilum]